MESTSPKFDQALQIYSCLLLAEKGNLNGCVVPTPLVEICYLHQIRSFGGTLSSEFWITEVTSVAVSAEILLRSPRKIFIFIINKYFYRIKVSQKKINLNLKKTSLPRTKTFMTYSAGPAHCRTPILDGYAQEFFGGPSTMREFKELWVFRSNSIPKLFPNRIFETFS